ncbi:hypothetical protein Hdeb2414_s0016g00488511 [Helianthus debilis subsp. tardiflorus]
MAMNLISPLAYFSILTSIDPICEMDRLLKKYRVQCQNRKVKTNIRVDLRSTHEDSETDLITRP